MGQTERKAQMWGKGGHIGGWVSGTFKEGGRGGGVQRNSNDSLQQYRVTHAS